MSIKGLICLKYVGTIWATTDLDYNLWIFDRKIDFYLENCPPKIQ